MADDSALIGRLREGLALGAPGGVTEADTRQRLIDPVVAWLGYDAARVRLESHVAGNRPDYLLYAEPLTEGGPAQAVVEAKPLGADFDRVTAADRTESRVRRRPACGKPACGTRTRMGLLRLLTLIAAMLAWALAACVSDGAAPDAAATPDASPTPTAARPPGGPCANGIAVPEPDRNPGLVEDCNALLAARDAFAASGPLPKPVRTWSADRDVSHWWGVGLGGGSSPRVHALILSPLAIGAAAEVGMEMLEAIPPRPRPDPAVPVSGISAGSAFLGGSIPPDLGRLAELRDLDLGWNELTGAIPPELGDLDRLERLLLDGNDLSGSIPPELGRLVRLRALSLGGNRLTGGIPPGLGGLVALEHLDLAYNELSGGIPPEIGSLVRLRGLYLQANRLTGDIPPELADLTALDFAGLFGNRLSGSMPPPGGPCSNGVAVPEPGQNRALVRHCNTLLAVRDDLAGDADLNWSADLPISAWDGTLESAGGVSVDNILQTWGAEGKGSAPHDMPYLGILGLSRLGLTGGIPPELGRLAFLNELVLADNDLTGSIPPELGDLAFLRVLDLSGNDLTGGLPPELGGLHLNWLVLDDDLGGCLPPRLHAVYQPAGQSALPSC